MYDVKNWFWFIMGDDTRVFSSKRRMFVDPKKDADYKDFLEAGLLPSTTRTVDDLCETLNASIITEIEEVEAGQGRHVREISMGKGDVVSGTPPMTPKQRLAKLDEDVKSLRLTFFDPATLEN